MRSLRALLPVRYPFVVALERPESKLQHRATSSCMIRVPASLVDLSDPPHSSGIETYAYLTCSYQRGFHNAKRILAIHSPLAWSQSQSPLRA